MYNDNLENSLHSVLGFELRTYSILSQHSTMLPQ